jgi:hypothetical protein
MHRCECENLDAFLAEDLPANSAKCFEAHLDECASCRDAVDEQRWIDGLLQSPLRLEIESPGAALVELIDRHTSPRRRQTRLIAYGLAAAAALVIALGWIARLNRQSLGPAAPNNPAVALNRAEGEPSPDPSLSGRGISGAPSATFVGGPDVLVVPVASRHPNVTIVRVYPTYQPGYDVQAQVEPFDLDDLNGG